MCCIHTHLGVKLRVVKQKGDVKSAAGVEKGVERKDVREHFFSDLISEEERVFEKGKRNTS